MMKATMVATNVTMTMPICTLGEAIQSPKLKSGVNMFFN